MAWNLIVVISRQPRKIDRWHDGVAPVNPKLAIGRKKYVYNDSASEAEEGDEILDDNFSGSYNGMLEIRVGN